MGYITATGKEYKSRPGPAIWDSLFPVWRDLYISGSSIHAIADLYGTHGSTVLRVLRKNGIQLQRRSPRKRKDSARVERLRAQARDSYRKRNYGVSPDQAVALLDWQGWKCGICKTHINKRSPIDHNHLTGKVRGILCGNCNRGLGFLEADKGLSIVQAALRYLSGGQDARRTRKAASESSWRDGEAGAAPLVVPKARSTERGLDRHCRVARRFSPPEAGAGTGTQPRASGGTRMMAPTHPFTTVACCGMMVSLRKRHKADGTEVESCQYTVTVPAAIVDAFGWSKRTLLEIGIEGKGVLKIREVKGSGDGGAT